MASNTRFTSKIKHIETALRSDPVDIVSLRKLAISPGGLVNSNIRRKVWPYLLDVANKQIERPQNVKNHSEYHQVVLDVERCGKRFPSGLSEDEKLKLQDQLTHLILSVLCKHPELHYYQGYHDICITFLFVCGHESSLSLVEKLSTHHLRDFMDPTMKSTTNILNYLIPILEKSNPDLVTYMQKSEVGTVFALSWLITWYSYVLQEQSDIERLYDFFLSCHPLMPVYFAAQVVLDNAESIVDGECDMARVYKVLLDTARKPDLPLEALITKASDFYIQFPPSSLAQNAADYYKNNLAMSTFCDYALVAQHEVPDVVLRRRGLFSDHETQPKAKQQPNNAKSSHWTTAKTVAVAVGGAVGAAVIAASGHILQWSPELLSYF